MTEFQKKQPLSTFIATGRKSYLLGVQSSNNPYDKQPFRDLWDKGWRLERRQQIGQFPSAKRVPFPAKSEQGTERKPYAKDRPAQARRTTLFNRPEPKKDGPVVTQQLVTRFNRRNQTTS